MRPFCTLSSALAMFALTHFALGQTAAPAADPAASFNIYAGNTHSHTAYTWSHGEHLQPGCKGILVYGKDPSSDLLHSWSAGYVKGNGQCPAMFVINGFQYPGSEVKVKPDWQNFQGSPAVHFATAKAEKFDFYVTSDHSQEGAFLPSSAENRNWIASRREAEEATDKDFVGIAGFEYSENDGPGGTGHINVINSLGILNALQPGVDLPYFYKWLKTVKANGPGPVVASFNHPGPDSYASFADRTPEATEIITMLEVINGNRFLHYEGFLSALDHGWKVSPVAGNDNHGLTGIHTQRSRTFVLAKSKTKEAILEGMKQRRTYASLDNNIQCRYSVNGKVMGSTLAPAGEYRFHIRISDPDRDQPKDKITRIDIVKDGGEVAQTYEVPSPDFVAEWSPVIKDSVSSYFFVRVWSAGGGDAPGADAAKPIAWLAPVWTGRVHNPNAPHPPPPQPSAKKGAEGN